MNAMRNFCQKYKEVFLYLLFGLMTTLVSLLAFKLFYESLGQHEHLANILSWIVAVSFAYFTNSIWVFHAAVTGWRGQLTRLINFYTGRLATLGMEEGILLILVTWLGMPALPIKTAAQVLVVAMNYVISKLFVFRE